MHTDAYGFVTHEESDSAVPGGSFAELLNMEPVGAAVKAYVDAFVIAHNANPTDAIVAALIGTPGSLTATALGPLPHVASSSAARDVHWGTPASAATRRALQDLGATTLRTDLGYAERYFAGLTDGGANPGGRATPGWYQVSLGPDTAAPYITSSTAARDARWGTPATAAARRALQDIGATTVRTDLGSTEQYFAGLTDGGANPGGKGTPGWYTVGYRTVLRRYRAAAATIATNTAGATVITLDTTSLSRGPVTDTFDITTTADRIIMKRPCTIKARFGFQFAANADVGRRVARLLVNGAIQREISVIGGVAGASAMSDSEMELDVLTGDYVQLALGQGSGATLSVAGTSTYLQIEAL